MTILISFDLFYLDLSSGYLHVPSLVSIGSAPHRLAKCLAKPLTQLLGTVSDSHLKNSGQLLNRLNDVDFKNKLLTSFDVKALFTSVPVKDATTAIKQAILNVPQDNFPCQRPIFSN